MADFRGLMMQKAYDAVVAYARSSGSNMPFAEA